ncbi:uncharacterized protein LOC133203480 [Saccostrea echinata]|uniref:uncharacterized protein LOC133203480 n=1 Tax=Saccostrea echinata TaxID=191078 RepID=UPI002A81D8AD|nr:uncharacterized protein LOC133203480 [Saccostrea echinata]
MEVTQIPLPYGKSYHIFLSFCHEDEETAHSLLKNLEDHYKLRCLYHIRDFVPGVTSMDNILNGIENSMKIVYLISSRFKENETCKREISYGITASHKQCENTMIPVLLERIEMPRELETLNYIDATIQDIDIASKIYDACLFEAQDRSILPTFIPLRELYNGQPLRVMESEKHWELGIPILNFYENTKKRHVINNKPRSRQIDFLCDKIIKDLNSSSYKKWYLLHDPGFLCLLWFLISCGLIAIILACFFIYLIHKAEISHEVMAAACSTGIIIPVVTVSVIFCRCCDKTTSAIMAIAMERYPIRKKEKELKKIMWRYLVENYQTLKILPLLSTNEKIIVLHYDTDPCKKEAEERILRFIEDNQDRLATWTFLEDFKFDRHNTYRQKKCFCQYLEPYVI